MSQATQERSKGADVVCVTCGEGWPILDDEAFCGFCGAPAAAMEVELFRVQYAELLLYDETRGLWSDDGQDRGACVILYADELQGGGKTPLRLSLRLTNTGSARLQVAGDSARISSVLQSDKSSGWQTG